MSRRSSLCRAGLLLLLLLQGADALAKIYQCQVDGRTVYTDQPCGGLGSENQNLYVSPEKSAKADPAAPVPSASPAVPAAAVRPDDVPPPAGTRAAAKPRRTPRPPAPPASAGPAPGQWRLAGEYSDRIDDPADTAPKGKRRKVKRSSYGVECTQGGERRRIYAVNGLFSLRTPNARGVLDDSAPQFESLDAAATAACAGSAAPKS